MPALKPSQGATLTAIVALAVGGVGVPVELAAAHPTFALIWGFAWLVVATAANVAAPYLASIGD